MLLPSVHDDEKPGITALTYVLHLYSCIGLASWLSIVLHDFLFYRQPDCIKGDVLCLRLNMTKNRRVAVNCEP